MASSVQQKIIWLNVPEDRRKDKIRKFLKAFLIYSPVDEAQLMDGLDGQGCLRHVELSSLL